jgi:3-oxoacyl-[acyl-carrier-protein] synthase-3
MSCRILSVGGCLPGKPVPNSDLRKYFETNDEWIKSRTGILQRYFKEGAAYEMAYEASINAIKNAKIEKSDIDLIIVATTTPDRSFPSTATTLQGMLSIGEIPSFDINAVCSGFVYGLEVANALMERSNYKKILLVGVDKMSSVLDMKDRTTDVLFGDGAGAVILQRDENSLFDSIIRSDGTFSDILKTEKTDTHHDKIHMKGQEVYKHAVTKMSELAYELMARNNLSKDDVDYFVPHQANIRIIDAVAEKLKFDDKKIIKTVSLHANTSSATIPLALEFMRENQINKNSLILMTAIGAGLTYGAALVRF